MRAGLDRLAPPPRLLLRLRQPLRVGRRIYVAGAVVRLPADLGETLVLRGRATAVA